MTNFFSTLYDFYVISSSIKVPKRGDRLRRKHDVEHGDGSNSMWLWIPRVDK